MHFILLNSVVSHGSKLQAITWSRKQHWVSRSSRSREPNPGRDRKKACILSSYFSSSSSIDRLGNTLIVEPRHLGIHLFETDSLITLLALPSYPEYVKSINAPHILLFFQTSSSLQTPSSLIFLNSIIIPPLLLYYTHLSFPVIVTFFDIPAVIHAASSSI